jgi:hypothetical protein
LKAGLAEKTKKTLEPYNTAKNATKKHKEDVDKYANLLKTANEAVSTNAQGLSKSAKDEETYNGLIKALNDKIGVKEVKAVVASDGPPKVEKVDAVAATALEKSLGEKIKEMETQ